jgi:hypothetical protein
MPGAGSPEYPVPKDDNEKLRSEFARQVDRKKKTWFWDGWFIEVEGGPAVSSVEE